MQIITTFRLKYKEKIKSLLYCDNLNSIDSTVDTKKLSYQK